MEPKPGAWQYLERWQDLLRKFSFSSKVFLGQSQDTPALLPMQKSPFIAALVDKCAGLTIF